MTVSAGKAYVFGSEVFVAHPQHRGAWCRTHICIVLVDCPYCDATRGTLCRDPKTGFAHPTTHAARRKAAKSNEVGVTIITGLQILELEDQQ